MDERRGLEWLLKVVDYHDAYAEYVLGEVYAEGRLLPMNLETSQQWHRKIALQGLAEVMSKCIESPAQEIKYVMARCD